MLAMANETIKSILKTSFHYYILVISASFCSDMKRIDLKREMTSFIRRFKHQNFLAAVIILHQTV